MPPTANDSNNVETMYREALNRLGPSRTTLVDPIAAEPPMQLPPDRRPPARRGRSLFTSNDTPLSIRELRAWASEFCPSSQDPGTGQLAASRHSTLSWLLDHRHRTIYRVINRFSATQRDYLNYSEAAAHFRALVRIDMQGYSGQDRTYGSRARFYYSTGQVTCYELPRVRNRCRVFFQCGGSHSRPFRTYRAMARWVSRWEGRTPQGSARAGLFTAANQINWTEAVDCRPRSGSPELPKVYDALYASEKSKGRLRRLRLKSRTRRDALLEFSRIALKMGYRKVALLKARPIGRWEDCYTPPVEEASR